MIKLSVNETKWSSLLVTTHAFILYISISIFDFGPEKLPGLSRNGPQETKDIENQPSKVKKCRTIFGFSRWIYTKIEFSSQRREILLFLATNMAFIQPLQWK